MQRLGGQLAWVECGSGECREGGRRNKVLHDMLSSGVASIVEDALSCSEEKI